MSLLLLEGGLQLASRVVPSVGELLAPRPPKVLIPDRVLGLRGNPEHPALDEWGYRNRARPDHADVVVLGDSQTYGTGVALDEAWPAVLAARLRVPGYSMALGTFGPPHYLLELDRALSLSPRLVVVAVYFGNDMYDAFVLARRNPDIARLVSADALAAADALERERPLADDIDVLFRRGEQRGKPLPPGPRRWLSNHSKLYGVARLAARVMSPENDALLSRDFTTAVAALTPELRRYCTPVESGGWRTILTAPYRARAVDDGDPRIRLGIDVTHEALRRIALRAREAGVPLLVVLIPTKESVFVARETAPTPDATLALAVDREARLRRAFIATLDAASVPWLDPLPALRAAPSQPYFEDADGHPNAGGHRVVAEAVAGYVEEHPALGLARASGPH